MQPSGKALQHFLKKNRVLLCPEAITQHGLCSKQYAEGREEQRQRFEFKTTFRTSPADWKILFVFDVDEADRFENDPHSIYKQVQGFAVVSIKGERVCPSVWVSSQNTPLALQMFFKCAVYVLCHVLGQDVTIEENFDMWKIYETFDLEGLPLVDLRYRILAESAVQTFMPMRDPSGSEDLALRLKKLDSHKYGVGHVTWAMFAASDNDKCSTLDDFLDFHENKAPTLFSDTGELSPAPNFTVLEIKKVRGGYDASPGHDLKNNTILFCKDVFNQWLITGARVICEGCNVRKAVKDLIHKRFKKRYRKKGRKHGTRKNTAFSFKVDDLFQD